MKRVGKIKYNGVKLEEHEKETLSFLAAHGYDIEVMRPQNIPNSKNADICIDGVVWEMKCSMGKSEISIKKLFDKAVKQSSHIIMDLRNTRMSNSKARGKVLKEYYLRRNVRELIIIEADSIDRLRK